MENLNNLTLQIGQNPHDPELYSKRAILRFNNRDFEKSYEDREKAISLYVINFNTLITEKERSDWRIKSHEIKKRIGDLNFHLGEYREAVISYSYHFDGMSPSELFGEKLSIYARDLGNLGKKLLGLKKQAKKRKKEKNNDCPIKQSETVFSKLIQKSGGEFRAWFYSHRGDAYYYLEEYEKAIKDFSSIIEKKPGFSNGISFYDRGLCFKKIGKVEEMINDLRMYLNYDKTYIGDIIDRNENKYIYIHHSLKLLEKSSEDIFCKRYYYHLMNSTLSRKLEDETGLSITLPGSYITSVGITSDSVESILLELGFFMAYTALHKLEDPEKMFEIATYCMIMKSSLMKDTNYVERFQSLIHDFYVEDETERIEERFEFIINSGIIYSKNDVTQDEEEEEGEEEGDLSSLNVKWITCDQNIFIKKYFLDILTSFFLKEEDVDFVLSNKVARIDPIIIYKCLYGIGLSDEELVDNIFNLFFFFKELHLYGHIFALCHSVSRFDLRMKMILFNRSISKFEKKKEEREEKIEEEKVDRIEEMIDGKVTVDDFSRESFNSPISLALFNQLQNDLELITMNQNYIQALDSLGYLHRIKHSKSVGFAEHSLFNGNLLKDAHIFDFEDEIFESFEDIFQYFVLKNLYKSKNYSSNYLFTKDDGIFRVHKDVLALKSNFFYQMFKFPGLESNSKNIMIDDLSGDSLRILLEWIYLDNHNLEDVSSSTTSSHLRTMFELLIHSEMYQNISMKSEAVRVIDGLFAEYKNDELLLKIMENVKYIGKMPEWYRHLMVKCWEDLSKLTASTLNTIINKSLETERTVNSLKEEIKGLKETIKRKIDNDANNHHARKKRKKE